MLFLFQKLDVVKFDLLFHSSSCVKKQLATDNLSTWLSTRYAANQTKKSNTEVQSNDLQEENLDMWLSQKRRKMSEQHSEKDSDMSEVIFPIFDCVGTAVVFRS